MKGSFKSFFFITYILLSNLLAGAEPQYESDAIEIGMRIYTRRQYLDILDDLLEDSNEVYLKSLMLTILLVGKVDAWLPSKNRLLHWAVSTNQLDAVKLLISIKATANVTDNFGRSPIHYVTSTKIAKELIKAKADLEQTGIVPYSHYHGWDDNDYEEYHYTPLHRAIVAHRLDIVKVLIEGKANANSKDQFSRVPLELTTNIDVAQLLLSRMKQQNCDDILQTAILEARGDDYTLKLIENLLKIGSNFSSGQDRRHPVGWMEKRFTKLNNVINNQEQAVIAIIIDALKFPKPLARIIAKYNFCVIFMRKADNKYYIDKDRHFEFYAKHSL